MTSTRENFAEGYDLSNELFRLWLDERMHYTSAVFDEQHTTLEGAQRNRDRILADFAGVTADTLVLDPCPRLSGRPRPTATRSS